MNTEMFIAKMKQFVVSAALLAAFQSAGAAVTPAAIHRVTLDVVNARLAPDGFARSMCSKSYLDTSMLIICTRHCCGERPVSPFCPTIAYCI
jgi:hypothetical protein